MGLCRRVEDIYDNLKLEKLRKEYTKLYCPKNFELKKEKNHFGQFNYYQSALFKIKY